MKYRIALLLKQHLIDYCKTKITNLSDRLELSYYVYNSLDELKSLYLSLKTEFDGFVTSGVIPHRLLTQLGRDDDVSFACFRFDMENTYRLLLGESVRRGGIDLTRVGLDCLSDTPMLAQAIADDQLPQAAAQFENSISQLPFDELDSFEDHILQSYLRRFQNQELDLILTGCYSVVEAFAELPLDCQYIYPSYNECNDALHAVVQSIDRRNMQQSLPAVIRVDFTSLLRTDPARIDTYTPELQRLLFTAIDKMNHSMSLKSGTGYFELYTDSGTVKNYTDKFRSCPLFSFLQKESAFQGAIGYGIGTDFYTARANALRATCFAADSAAGLGGSYLIDQNRMLTCLAGADSQEEKWLSSLPDDYVNRVAARAKLSSTVIRRLMNLLAEKGNNELTSAELIDRLGISVRTANRYLLSLKQGGLATITQNHPSGGRGRPSSVYQINFGR